jgi:hypothetical protein
MGVGQPIPGALRGHSALSALDVGRKALVVLGEGGEGTWVLDGGGWHHFDASAGPGGGPFVGGMVYDPRSDGVMLVKDDGATSTWDGNRWRPGGGQMFFGHLPNFATMATDEARGGVVLYGAVGNTAHFETWNWDGTNWSRRSTATGPQGTGKASYDPLTRSVLDVIGALEGFNSGDTWSWDGFSWRKIVSGTVGLFTKGSPMAFDRVTGRLLLFYGPTCGQPCFSETWSWDGKSWAKESAPNTPLWALAFVTDPYSGRPILFGSTNAKLGQPTLDAEWVWTGSDWSSLH